MLKFILIDYRYYEIYMSRCFDFLSKLGLIRSFKIRMELLLGYKLLLGDRVRFYRLWCYSVFFYGDVIEIY